MIALNLAAIQKLIYDYDGDDFKEVVEGIKELAPKGVKADDRFIGNCLYTLANDYCKNDTMPRQRRIAFQEFVFNNYRVSGILDKVVDVNVFT